MEEIKDIEDIEDIDSIEEPQETADTVPAAPEPSFKQRMNSGIASRRQQRRLFERQIRQIENKIDTRPPLDKVLDSIAARAVDPLG